MPEGLSERRYSLRLRGISSEAWKEAAEEDIHTNSVGHVLVKRLEEDQGNVALIVLYVLAGLLLLVFFGIVGSAVVKAHRHPERYGPRTGEGSGQPQQSRARGLARAVLDTLPIVHFGGSPRADEPGKADIEALEVADGYHAMSTVGPVAVPAPQHSPLSSPTLPPRAVVTEDPSSDEAAFRQQRCPVCVEDFVTGQVLRVLPCRHQFHPECVDPWLLNVSGSCPLCRIDLHPDTDGKGGYDTPESPQTPDTVDYLNRGPGYLNIARGTTGQERLDALRSLRDENRDPARIGGPEVPRRARSRRPELGINRLRRAVSRRAGSNVSIATIVEGDLASERR